MDRNQARIAAGTQAISEMTQEMAALLKSGVTDEQVTRLGRAIHDKATELIGYTDELGFDWLVEAGYLPPF